MTLDTFAHSRFDSQFGMIFDLVVMTKLAGMPV
jgi:hypothetical protein